MALVLSFLVVSVGMGVYLQAAKKTSRPSPSAPAPAPAPAPAVEGGERSPAEDAVHLSDDLYGGHPASWWGRRLSRLQKEKSPLFDLTRQRAEANGLEVRELNAEVEVRVPERGKRKP